MYQKRDKIIKTYLTDFGARHYLREISRLANLPIRTTQRVLEKLEKENIVKSEKRGKNKYYFLNLQDIKTKLCLLIAEVNKTSEFLDKYPTFKSFIKEKIDSCLVVFGSFAELKATKTSDLDLLIIGNGKEKIPFYLLPYKIHKIELSEAQFKKAIERREALTKEILKNHVILTKHSSFLDLLWEYYGKA